MIHALELKYFRQKGGGIIPLMNVHEWVAIIDKKTPSIIQCSLRVFEPTDKKRQKVKFDVICLRRH